MGIKSNFCAWFFSGYHVWVDDTFGSSITPPGAYDFIHQFFDPSLYYGSVCTTKLELVGLQNSCVRPYYNDSRVAGWYFGGEWCVSAQCPYYAKEQAFINKYWDFFYSLVHWQGSQTGFAGIYPLAGPDLLARVGEFATQNRIDCLKQLFPPASSNCSSESVSLLNQPDIFGVEWYGNCVQEDPMGNCITSYDLTHISSDTITLANWMMNDIYPVPANRIALMEGGTYQVNAPSAVRQQFFTDAIDTAASA
ncbi:MAG: hypothetical protein HYR55_09115 [Acidobacteria bacterium]|nr:hypothetical protein [Acidobacteriota bacterium]